MRIVGQWTRRARAIAREFQGSLDQMVREAELDDVKRHIDRATSFDVEHEIRRAVDPTGELQQSLNEPVLANPLADPPKPVETKPLPPVPESALAVPPPLPAPAEVGAGEDRPAVPEPEKRTP
jgi:sec-independent protein translocase protein TatB